MEIFAFAGVDVLEDEVFAEEVFAEEVFAEEVFAEEVFAEEVFDDVFEAVLPVSVFEEAVFAEVVFEASAFFAAEAERFFGAFTSEVCVTPQATAIFFSCAAVRSSETTAKWLTDMPNSSFSLWLATMEGRSWGRDSSSL